MKCGDFFEFDVFETLERKSSSTTGRLFPAMNKGNLLTSLPHPGHGGFEWRDLLEEIISKNM